jgi:cell division protease FtsH
MPEADPLHKITIIPRGRALGLTMQLPTEDKHTYRRNYVDAQIAILMGGRVAEELSQDDITTGAGNDIERATEIARQMVCEWGMSDLGPLNFGEKSEPVFLGRDFSQRADYSDSTAQSIDGQVTAIVQRGYEKAREILSEHRNLLEQLAKELLELESLEGGRVYEMVLEATGQDLTPVRKPMPIPDLEPPDEGAAAPAKEDAPVPDVTGTPEPATIAERQEPQGVPLPLPKPER